MRADGKFTSVSLAQKFNLYGIYADYGVGTNTPIDNPGDLGRDNKRLSPSGASFTKNRRRWFSRKYFASVMNIRELFADNLGKDLADTVGNALTRDISRRFVI